MKISHKQHVFVVAHAEEANIHPLQPTLKGSYVFSFNHQREYVWDWICYKAPAKVEELFAKTDGNKFASINAPTAGAREEKGVDVGC